MTALHHPEPIRYARALADKHAADVRGDAAAAEALRSWATLANGVNYTTRTDLLADLEGVCPEVSPADRVTLSALLTDLHAGLDREDGA